MSVTDERKLFEDFQKTWTLEKVKNMTLEEYTGIKSNGERNDFTYWLEIKLKCLGDFGGGDAGTRFGIYRYGEIPKKNYSYDDTYAWQKKLGNSANEVFEKIRDEIVKVANFSKNNELSKIDNLNLLFFGFKWKIALLYQNPDDIQMFCIFSKDLLKRIAKNELDKENLSISQIYMQLMSDKKYTLEASIQERSEPLFKKYGNKNNKDDENEGDTMPNTPTTKNPPLNQILYGPPGTGKTYNTINKALEILGVETQGKSRAELKAQFDKFRQNGQIEFVTFHQSFSYEEFVEGIKPIFKKKNENEKTDKMEYEIANGIFKKICKAAQEKIINFKETGKKDFYPAFYKKLKKDGPITYDKIKFEIDEKVTSEATNKEFKSGNITIYSSKLESILNNIKALDNEKFDDIITQEIKPTEQYEKDNIGRYKAIVRYYFDKYLPDESRRHNYILIIDEINRGNISKILGELITLIEPSKRIGGDEELRVTLPYSNESFGVPKNLYIIGTMNTADRSIALLDTALRRRFEFVEMMPEPELLEIIKVENGEINLQMLLEKMNARIEFLLDREHTIGHSFFINVNSLSELQQVFKNKIIPLLQEYFYDDYAKIDAVLNGNGMMEPKKVSTLEKLFDTNFKSDLDSEKVVYQITNFNKWNEKNFLRIYDSSVQIDKDE